MPFDLYPLPLLGVAFLAALLPVDLASFLLHFQSAALVFFFFLSYFLEVARAFPKCKGQCEVRPTPLTSQPYHQRDRGKKTVTAKSLQVRASPTLSPSI